MEYTKTVLNSGENNLLINHRENKFDKFVIKEVLMNNVWFQRGLKFNKKDKWIDMGGHIGTFSLLVLANGGIIYEVYEPSKENYTLLKKNLGENNFCVSVLNKSVWDRNDIVSFYYCDDGTNHRNTMFNHYTTKIMNKSEIECVDFKDIIFPGCCVKMDIEGAELDIIDNRHEYFKNIHKMVFEYHFDKDNYNRDNYFVRMKILEKYFKNVKYQSNLGKGDKFFPSGRPVYCYN